MGSRSINMQCWKCGSELKNVLLPFSRYEECNVCKADLHCCLSCRHYAPQLADACEEDRAESVFDKDKANFCDYFKVNSKAYKPVDNSEAEQAKKKLAALFGEEQAGEEQDGTDPDQSKKPPATEAELALAELQRLFNTAD